MIGFIANAITATAIALVGGVLWYGHSQYTKGFNEAVIAYEQRDREGAEDARNTAKNTLRDIDGIDTERLLDDTNGFRD